MALEPQPADAECDPVPAPALALFSGDLLVPIMSKLPANDRVLVRLICKSCAAGLKGPNNTTLHLSQPVPPAEFAQHWGAPGAMRELDHDARQLLLCLVARSGSTANLDAAVRCSRLAPGPEVLAAAAAAGDLAMCRHLHRVHQVPLTRMMWVWAAHGGSVPVLQWLHQEGCPMPTNHEGTCIFPIDPMDDLEGRAASQGHVDALRWLSSEGVCPAPSDKGKRRLTAAVAFGCSLPQLQELHREWGIRAAGLGVGADAGATVKEQGFIVTAAAASTTPDWRDKVLWLVGQGHSLEPCPWGYAAAAPGYAQHSRWCVPGLTPDVLARAAAARCTDSLQSRLEWLQEQGYPAMQAKGLLRGVACAAECGDVGALRYLLTQLDAVGTRPQQESDPAFSTRAAAAARGGHLAVLQLLQQHGYSMGEGEVDRAAACGHIHVLEWLSEVVTPLRDFTVSAMEGLASGARPEVLFWLLDGFNPQVPRNLVKWGTFWRASEADMTRLKQRGFSMKWDSAAYVYALRAGDLGALDAMARLGVPLRVLPTPDVLGHKKHNHRDEQWQRLMGCDPDVLPTPLASLKWLVEERGVRLKWGLAVRLAEEMAYPGATLELLRGKRVEEGDREDVEEEEQDDGLFWGDEYDHDGGWSSGGSSYEGQDGEGVHWG